MNNEKATPQTATSVPVSAKPNVAVDGVAQEPMAENPESGEVGGPKGPEPTRFGDWEKKGRCIDF